MRSGTRRILAAAFALAALFGGAAPARAEEPTTCPICSKASSQTVPYGEKAGSTLTRGAMNAALGWTEIISQPVHEVQNGGNVLVGIGKGIGQTFSRTAAGIGEVLTFWTPKVQNRYVGFATDCPICMKRTPVAQASAATATPAAASASATP
jgi:putative exosortase-associated protein (TIGR04073 family)